MITAVVVFGLIGAVTCLAIGVASAIGVRQKRKDVLDAIVAPEPARPGVPPPVTNQSLSSTLDSVAKLAAALKDLDRVAQMFTLGLGFLAVAAVAAGVDAVAEAVG